MINPYAKVDFGTATQIKSFSHMHVNTSARLQMAYAEGYKHFCPSNYQPAKPYYPLADVFQNVPNDILGSPNSEKVKLINGGHICAVGSFHEGYGHETSVNTAWKTVFDDVLAGLQFPDAGGITLNHPDDFNTALRCEMLDHDSRVLGIEIFNNCEEHAREGYNEPYYKGWYKQYLTLWDNILRTGRRCWGFAVTDWQDDVYLPHYGSNILIVPEFTEYQCLKAYRDGNFYGIIKDTGLRFSRIAVSGEFNNQCSAEVNKEATLNVYTDKGLVKSTVGQYVRYDVKQDDIFVRVEAIDNTDEDGHIFSNPIMFKTKEEVEKKSGGFERRKRLLLLNSDSI